MPLHSEDPLCLPQVTVYLISMLKEQSSIRDSNVFMQNLSQSGNVPRLAVSAGGSATVSKPGTPAGGTTHASQGRATQELSRGGNQCTHITGAADQAVGEDTLQVHPLSKEESFDSDSQTQISTRNFKRKRIP